MSKAAKVPAKPTPTAPVKQPATKVFRAEDYATLTIPV